MATHVPLAAGMSIPSPPFEGFHIGPLFIHVYALMYLVGIAAAIVITRRRWIARGGNPDLVYEVAMWCVPAGIVGGRIYFDITTPMDIPHEWYGVFAVWQGGLGIWGAVALAIPVGAWRVRRHGASVGQFMDAVAPGLLVAQGIGRIGNYFNKELFGGPTNLPWAVQIPYRYRVLGGIPGQDLHYATFHPSFLYELLWDFLLAGLIVWAGHHFAIRVKGQFALYVTGYSAYRIFEESIRIDSSQYFLGLRLNEFVAIGLTIAGAAWFGWIQRYGKLAPSPPAQPGLPAGTATAADPGTGPAPSGQAEPAPGGKAASTPVTTVRSEGQPPGSQAPGAPGPG